MKIQVKKYQWKYTIKITLDNGEILKSSVFDEPPLTGNEYVYSTYELLKFYNLYDDGYMYFLSEFQNIPLEIINVNSALELLIFSGD